MSFDYICSYLVFNVQVLHIEALTPSKLNSQLLNVYCLKRQHSVLSGQRPLKIPSKGGDPAAPSDTATLLRLHPDHWSHLRQLRPVRVRSLTSVVTDSRGVPGGVSRARERFHPAMLIRDSWRFLFHLGEFRPQIGTA